MKSGYPSFNHKRRETKHMFAKIELELDWVGAQAFRASESSGEISFPWPDMFHLLGTNASVTLWTQREASKKSWTRQHREATVKGPELSNDDINRHEPVLVGALVLHCRVCVAVADSRGSLVVVFLYNQAKIVPGDKVLNHLSNAVNLSYNYITFIWFYPLPF